MGLFDKKFCDVCGQKIGLLGNKKLEDGNLCKDCAAKLSPYFYERRQSTVKEIKEQLAYREANKAEVAILRPTTNFGDYYKVYIDEKRAKFIVTCYKDWRDNNPDVLNLKDIIAVNLDVDEDRKEIFDKDDEGKSISFNPPKYEYSYDFKIDIEVIHPYIQHIKFKLNNKKIDNKFSMEYRNYQLEANELSKALTGKELNHEIIEVVNKPNVNQNQGFINNQFNQPTNLNIWTCQCGMQNTGNFCQNCGSPKPMQTAFFCQNCGTRFDNPNNLPKFCPNCGAQLR